MTVAEVSEASEPARRGRLTGAQRRREIIAAAQSVFATSGLGGARTAQIADAAGVAESMLYKHFSSKRELFEAAVTQPVAEFVQSVVDEADGLLDRDGPGSERFYRSFLDTMTEVLPLLGVALFSDSEQGKRFYNDSIVPLFDRYQNTLEGSLTAVPGARVDAGFLARAVIGIMFLLSLDATYRTAPSPMAGQRDALADEVRSFVAGALTGSGADDLLGRLEELEAGQSTGQSTGEPPAPEMVSPAAWTRFWTARARRRVDDQDRLRHLETENATLRRIVADQAIELRLRQEAEDKS
jgi:AcrR family transcriptional regulator